VSVHTVKPLEEPLLAGVFSSFPLVAVAEEHGLIGGLGSAVAEWLAPRWPRPAARFLSFGTPDAFLCEGGSQEYARARLGLTPKAIAARVRDAFVALGR
jgi:transketolase